MQQETERLREQMRKAVREFDRRLEHLVERGADEAAKASQRMGHGAEDVRIGLLDLEGGVALRGRQAGRHLKRGIGRHPWSAAGTVLALAAAVVFLVARRRRG